MPAIARFWPLLSRPGRSGYLPGWRPIVLFSLLALTSMAAWPQTSYHTLECPAKWDLTLTKTSSGASCQNRYSALINCSAATWTDYDVIDEVGGLEDFGRSDSVHISYQASWDAATGVATETYTYPTYNYIQKAGKTTRSAKCQHDPWLMGAAAANCSKAQGSFPPDFKPPTMAFQMAPQLYFPMILEVSNRGALQASVRGAAALKILAPGSQLQKSPVKMKVQWDGPCGMSGADPTGIRLTVKSSAWGSPGTISVDDVLPLTKSGWVEKSYPLAAGDWVLEAKPASKLAYGILLPTQSFKVTGVVRSAHIGDPTAPARVAPDPSKILPPGSVGGSGGRGGSGSGGAGKDPAPTVPNVSQPSKDFATCGAVPLAANAGGGTVSILFEFAYHTPNCGTAETCWTIKPVSGFGSPLPGSSVTTSVPRAAFPSKGDWRVHALGMNTSSAKSGWSPWRPFRVKRASECP